MIHVVPRRPIIVTEIPTILLTQSLVEFIHVPLMAVPHSQEVKHSAQAAEIQPKYLWEGDEKYLVPYTENTEPSYLSNNSDNNQTHNWSKELPEICPLLLPLKSYVFAHESSPLECEFLSEIPLLISNLKENLLIALRASRT
jgi:hypothetical protein